MGHREVKRVPLDFKAPLNKIWEGYVNPYSDEATKCAACDGSGSSPDIKFLSDSWYRHIAQGMFGAFFGDNIDTTWTAERYRRAGWSQDVINNIERAKKFGFTTLTHWGDKLHQSEVNALIKAGRLYDLTQEWKDGKWVKKDPQPKVTPKDVARWEAQSMGHDAINHWVSVRARARRFGIYRKNKKDWFCGLCQDGQIWPSQEIRRKYEKWKRKEPPKGPGWQLWETVTEGSPQSPVFDTPGKLAAWCAPNATIFASEKLSEQQWLRIIREDSVDVSSLMVVGDGKVGTVAKREMGEESPRDWMPDEKVSR